MNEQNKKITIDYIAKVTGYSLSTVSRALRKDTKTNQKTAEKIIKKAEELNYFPDLIAKGLRQKKTRTIGVILNDPNNPFYSEILSVIDKVLTENQYSMIVSYSNWDIERERNSIITLISKRVDGIIISPIFADNENLRILINNQVEFVAIDCLANFPDKSNVYTNNLVAGQIATEHLIENGHKKIMLFTFGKKYSQVKDFDLGYVQTLKKHNIEVMNELIMDLPESSIDSGYDCFKKVITGNIAGTIPDFTGIVSISDLLAIGVYEAANELKINIPGDFSIVGYDNIRFTKSLNPPLSTVHQPRKRIGSESIKILLNNINNEQKITKNIKLVPYLIQRESVKNIS